MKVGENRREKYQEGHASVEEEDIDDIYNVLKKISDEAVSIRKQLYFLNTNIEELVEAVK